MSPLPESSMVLGTVLVTGGCGFVGSHIVHSLLEEGCSGPIYVVSRHPDKNLQDGPNYRSIDLTNADAIDALLQEIKPKTVIHTASPRASDFSMKDGEFMDTNVNGTKNLLSSAARVALH